MAVAAVGEDDFVWCTSCDYAANVEVARRRAATRSDAEVAGVDAPPREKVHTPDLPGIAGVAEHLGVGPGELLKCIVFDLDGELGLALVPGDREVNPVALAQAVAPAVGAPLRPTRTSTRHPELAARATSAPTSRAPRSSSPTRSSASARELGHRRERDRPPRAPRGARPRLRGRRVGRPGQRRAAATRARAAARALSVDRGIEVGQVFQLGTKYAEALDALYTDEARRRSTRW